MAFSKLVLSVLPGFTSGQLCDGIANLFVSAGFTLVHRSSAQGTLNNIPTFTTVLTHQTATVFKVHETGTYGGLAIQIRVYVDTSQVVVHCNTGINYLGEDLIRPLASRSGVVTSSSTSQGLQTDTASGTDSNQVPWEFTLRYHNATPSTYYLLTGLSLTGPTPRGREWDWVWTMIPTANRASWFSEIGGTNSMSPWFVWLSGTLAQSGRPIIAKADSGTSSNLGHLYQVGLTNTATEPNASTGFFSATTVTYLHGYAGTAHSNSFLGARMLNGSIELRNNLLVAARLSSSSSLIGSSDRQWACHYGSFHSDVALGPAIGPTNTRFVVTAGSNEWEAAAARTVTSMAAGATPSSLFAGGPGIYLRAV